MEQGGAGWSLGDGELTAVRAGRLGAPFPGSPERLAGPAQPVQSSSDVGSTGTGKSGVEGDPRVPGAGANWAAGLRRDYPFTASQSRGQTPTEDGTIVSTMALMAPKGSVRTDFFKSTSSETYGSFSVPPHEAPHL